MNRTIIAAAVAGTMLAGCAGLDEASIHQIAGAVGQAYGQQAVLAETDIVSGLREALGQGVESAVTSLGRRNGFWDNASVRIPLPAELQQAEKTARKLGMGDKFDQMHLTLNRAAEQAVPHVADIFGAAVRQMTLEDARSILYGPNDAATQFFRRTSESELIGRIRPIVTDATTQVGVTQQYKALVSSYGPLLKLAGIEATDLDGYVTTKAVDGLFYSIAAEEARIRRDPRARTTELMRTVFGAQDR